VGGLRNPAPCFTACRKRWDAYDELIDKALVEPNEAKRNQLYEDAQKTAWEDAPWAFLLFEMSTGASNKHLKNFNMMVDQSFEFYNAEWVE